jgi:hypothetical protein
MSVEQPRRGKLRPTNGSNSNRAATGCMTMPRISNCAISYASRSISTRTGIVLELCSKSRRSATANHRRRNKNEHWRFLKERNSGTRLPGSASRSSRRTQGIASRRGGVRQTRGAAGASCLGGNGRTCSKSRVRARDTRVDPDSLGPSTHGEETQAFGIRSTSQPNWKTRRNDSVLSKICSRLCSPIRTRKPPSDLKSGPL